MRRERLLESSETIGKNEKRDRELTRETLIEKERD